VIHVITNALLYHRNVGTGADDNVNIDVGDDHLVSKFNTLRKGRLLLFRALLLLTAPYTYQVMTVIFYDLKQYAIPETPSPSDDKLAQVRESYVRPCCLFAALHTWCHTIV
jgi:hypothetical protein